MGSSPISGNSPSDVMDSQFESLHLQPTPGEMLSWNGSLQDNITESYLQMNLLPQSDFSQLGSLFNTGPAYNTGYDQPQVYGYTNHINDQSWNSDRLTLPSGISMMSSDVEPDVDWEQHAQSSLSFTDAVYGAPVMHTAQITFSSEGSEGGVEEWWDEVMDEEGLEDRDFFE